MKAIFERKPDFCFREFAVENSITIPAEIFSDLLRHPLLDREFIAEHIPQMYTDKNDVRHCLLIMGEGRTDGLLVDSEGAKHARYAAYVPEVADLEIGDDFEVTYHPGYCPHYEKQEEDEAGGIIPQ